MILSSELELKKVQTAVSRHLGILPKISGGGNSDRVWVKTASSWFIGFCEKSVFCLSGYLPVWLSTALSKISILHFFDFLQWLEIYKNQGAYLLKKV